jgi:UDPglucose 6-dehydrogenase
MRVSVFGVGKLGASVAHVLRDAGIGVVGVDPLTQGFDQVLEPGLDQRGINILDPGRAYEAVSATSLSLICVPTPSNDDGSYSTRYVDRCVETLADALWKKGGAHEVALMSTVLPGDTRRHVIEPLARLKHVQVGYNPAFIALGSVIRDFSNPDLVLIGSDNVMPRLWDMYSLLRLTRVMRVMSVESAEVAKIALNSYITMKMTYANFLGELCENIPNADAHDVVNAIGMDSRIGRACLTPAVGYGGPCFPRDNRAINQVGERVGVHVPYAHATDMTNLHMILRLSLMLPPDVSRVALVGVGYKVGTRVTEESPTLLLGSHLLSQGYEVRLYDTLSPGSPIDTTWADAYILMTPDPRWAEIDWPHDACIVDPWRLLLDRRYTRVRRVGAPDARLTGATPVDA